MKFITTKKIRYYSFISILMIAGLTCTGFMTNLLISSDSLPLPPTLEGDSDTTTPVASDAVDQYPVVIMPGWHGRGRLMDPMWEALSDAGYNVVDFTGLCVDADGETGKCLSYCATFNGYSFDGLKAADGIYAIAQQVLATINSKVVFEGTTTYYGSDGKWHTPKINLITHSMGGLVSRALLQNGDLANKLHHLINIQAPHWGVPLSNPIAGVLGDAAEWLFADGWDVWASSAYDMNTNSAYMQWLDTNNNGKSEIWDSPYQPDVWSCVAGNPGGISSIFGVLPSHNMNNPSDFANDGKTNVADTDDLTGFDGLVPQDGAWLIGANNYKIGLNHYQVGDGDEAVNIVLDILGSSVTYTGSSIPLSGNVAVRVSGFKSDSDMDDGTSNDGGDAYYKIWIDLDGDDYADDWVWAGELNPGDYVHQNQAWRDIDGPMTSPIWLNDYDISFVNVKVEVWDSDGLLNDDDLWASYVFKAVSLSSDIDLMGDTGTVGEYYANSNGEEIAIQINGFTQDTSQIYECKVDFYALRMDVSPDIFGGKGEMYFRTWVGMPGLERYYCFGYDDSMNDYDTNHENDDYYDSWGKGDARAIESYDRNKILEPVYLLKDGILRIKIQVWDNDGGNDDRFDTVFDWQGYAAPFVPNGMYYYWQYYDMGDYDIYLGFSVSEITGTVT